MACRHGRKPHALFWCGKRPDGRPNRRFSVDRFFPVRRIEWSSRSRSWLSLRTSGRARISNQDTLYQL